MVIHHRSYLNVPVSVFSCDANDQISNSTLQTKIDTVNGYLWGRWPHQTITYCFNAELPVHGRWIINPPYVDIEGAFFLPSASQPEVFNTLIQVVGHTLLVLSYFDTHLGPNPNLKCDFPHIPWCGEITVLFVRKRKPFVRRVPPDLVVCSAITQWVLFTVSWNSDHPSFIIRYMGECIACVELGASFLTHIKRFVHHLYDFDLWFIHHSQWRAWLKWGRTVSIFLVQNLCMKALQRNHSLKSLYCIGRFGGISIWMCYRSLPSFT